MIRRRIDINVYILVEDFWTWHLIEQVHLLIPVLDFPGHADFKIIYVSENKLHLTKNEASHHPNNNNINNNNNNNNNSYQSAALSRS